MLDVGGGEGDRLPALDFFPDEQIVVADVQALRRPRYVRASGLTLPFADGAFDVAFSCDTLEHVRPRDRDAFVRELFRVSRHYVVLLAPFHSAVTELAEPM